MAKQNPSQSGKNNYQDKAEEQEYKKGYSAGKGKRKGSKPRRNGKKPFNPKERFPDKIYEDKQAVMPVMAGKMMNDASWHIPSQALTAAAQVSTYFASGNGIVLPRASQGNSNKVIVGQSGQFALPGIMVFDVLPSFGNAKQAEDPINVAGNLIMTYLQQKTGRAPAYDAANVQFYLQAVTSAYDYYTYMCRIYGSLRTVELENRYYPKLLTAAQRASYDTLATQMADFRQVINLFALRLAALPLPNVYTYSKMTNQMYANIYRDSDTAKAQLYIFNPAGFWVYKEGVEAAPVPYLRFQSLDSYLGGTAEQSLTSSSQQWNVQKFKAFGEQLLQPLLLSGDIRMLASDILNSFGDSLYTVNPIAETYEVSSIYSEEIMMQIENSYIYGLSMTKSQFELHENTSLHGGWVQSDYAIVPNDILVGSTSAYTQFNGWMEKITNTTIPLNWHFQRAMTPEDVIVATRLTGTGLDGYNPPAGSGQGAFTEFRAQAYLILTNARIVYFASNGNTSFTSFDSINAYDYNGGIDQTNAYLNLLTLISKFDWHPPIRLTPYIISGSGDTATMTIYNSDYVLDIDNFSLLGEQQLTNINNVCQIGDFYPRGLGGYSPVK